MMSVERKRSEVAGLPPGWKREEIMRKSGLSAGRTDTYYFAPDGRKFRSKPQLVRALGDNYDLCSFDFKSGKILQSALRKRIRHDSNLVLPIRQTASIFKQPVTVVRNRSHSRTRTDLKHGPQDQPKQLFWEKRLQGHQACDINEERFRTLDLPQNIQGAGPRLSTENLLQSIAAALHVSNHPITGQSASRAALQKNPSVNVNTEQPLIQAVVVTEQDIRRQEFKVSAARRKLEQAMTTVNGHA